MSDPKLQLIPLGGLGEFGMNSMAIRYGDDIIVVDAGMMFPDAELLGVDIVTPDFAYLNKTAPTSARSSSRTATKTTSARCRSCSTKSTFRFTAPNSRWLWWNGAWKSTSCSTTLG